MESMKKEKLAKPLTAAQLAKLPASAACDALDRMDPAEAAKIMVELDHQTFGRITTEAMTRTLNESAQ
jgi:flagellar motility protein MotE (MotC chaperone)